MTLFEWLDAEPFTLTMSSGFFGFFAHCGMLAALDDAELKPSRITGSSAGALIGGCYAAGLTIDEIKELLFNLKKEDFWDPKLGLGLLAGRRFRALLNEILPANTFEDCNIPIAVSVHDGWKRKPVVFDSGDLIEAIYASCAVPFLFHPLRKGRKLYWDGGVSDRPGLLATKPDERIFYHHLASKSPWRTKNNKGLQIPSRPNLFALSIANITRLGPSRLELGKQAYQEAYQTVKNILNCPLQNDFLITTKVNSVGNSITL